MNKQTYSLSDALVVQLQDALKEWQDKNNTQRLWEGDPSLWSGSDEDDWLGWLGIAGSVLSRAVSLKEFAREVAGAGFRDVLLLGMGGSSLCPEVLRMTFGTIEGHPELSVLDSTDPGQIMEFETKLELSRSLFVVSSKSGSTLEPNIFAQYFFDRVERQTGPGKAGQHFVAITDPGSRLEAIARRDGFRRIFYGVPSIGGRYSALSDFGMVPGAIMGLDVEAFLRHSVEMVQACGPDVPAAEDPGVVLGNILGVLARNGRDKLTLIASPGIRDLGAWLEQLLAESTGKDGKGIIPVDRESPGPPVCYGQDRVFAYLRLDSAPDQDQDEAVLAIEQTGHPVIRISVRDPISLGQEFFRWEIATAVAGSLLGINAFNQPDVEASKVATRNLTTAYERTGALPSEAPILEEDGIRLFTDDRNATVLLGAAGRDRSLTGFLRAHLTRLGNADYFALLAYVQMNDSNEIRLQEIRHAVRDSKRVATCLGFGPRFLHSTGQAYKGGPNTGVFLQITCDDARDIPVPGQKYSFGIVKAAQARGDFEVLVKRDRRALRVHLAAGVESGLVRLASAILDALS